MKKIKQRFIFLMFFSSFFSMPCFAITPEFKNIFQYESSTFEMNSLQYNIFERDSYSGIGAKVNLLYAFNENNDYLMPVGTTVTYQLYQIEDEKGNPINRLLSDYPLTYQGEVGSCPNYWSDGRCQKRWAFSIYWTYPCAPEGRYLIKVLYNGSLVGEGDFIPTRYTPVIADVLFTKDSIRPKLSGDNFASKFMPTIDAEGTYVVTFITGVAGNQKQCIISLPDTTVKITNTVTSGSGGHAHFSSNNESGTGSYVPLLSGDKLDPGTPDTNGTVIEGKTLSDGVYYAFYTAGEFGVNETIMVDARRDKTTIHPEIKSDPVTRTLDIRAPDLVEMPQGTAEGEFKFNNGTTCNHSPTARWVVPQMKSRLVILDALYKNKFGHRLSFNDASLIFGGTFDSKNNTGRDSLCHESHRRGNDIDVNSEDENGQDIRTEIYTINNVAYKRLDFITRKAKFLGLEKVVEGPIHYRYINY